jgi:hypothetical protein
MYYSRPCTNTVTTKNKCSSYISVEIVTKRIGFTSTEITLGSSAPKNYCATKEDCPWHGLKGAYDFNQIRVTEDIKYHIFGGLGRKERMRGRKRRRRGRERWGRCRLFVVR